MHRIVVFVSLAASLAQGAAPRNCYPIVPGDRLLVPANTPVFIGPSYGQPSTLTLREVGSDAGVRELQQLDGGDPYFYALFDPGPLTAGQQLILESNESTCTAQAPVRSEVTVLDAAPFPTELGTITFAEPVGFIEYSRTGLPEDAVRSVKRDVLAVLPAEVHPWLSMLRVKVNGANTTFGHLARSVTEGSPTVVGSVVMSCNQSHDKFNRAAEVVLEIPGHPSVVRAELMTELDCGKAPPQPTGCSSVPVLSLGALALWLRRRSAQGR